MNECLALSSVCVQQSTLGHNLQLEICMFVFPVPTRTMCNDMQGIVFP
jgi:D-ribose pyranose/furanose isomerase RbsD